MSELKYYRLNKILKCNAQYNMIFGERSNGKTYACLEYVLKQAFNRGKDFAYVRRWSEDFRRKRGERLFSALESDGTVSKITDGEWTHIKYYGSQFFWARMEENKQVSSQFPIGFAFSITSMEHDKSTSYPNITTIVYDEFLTRGPYATDEFVLFTNLISTIVRQRNDVSIFMLGNTVNKYCPYFTEMGLTNVRNMKPGTIDIYEYGDSGLRVAVEYTKPLATSKASDVYFAFNNPKLKMITGGVWEIDIYPHCPVKYIPNDVIFTFFIEFDSDLLQCEIINHSDGVFLFIHRKTTPIKNLESDIIYSTTHSIRPNYRNNILKSPDRIERKIRELFARNKVFYQDNEVGEIVRNYLLWCKNKN